MTNLEIGEAQYALFVRINESLRERAGQIFEERARSLNPQLRHEINSIEFDESGCTISYTSTHCSNCRHYDEIDHEYISLNELLPVTPPTQPDNLTRQQCVKAARERLLDQHFQSARTR
ncbi:MAG: hypothetical protein C0507_00325 [Cyanobacteria bacterium PR.3.49]|jgi:hypothetical protein|nr:hypothetical protein [Cyanobacteria bacterium PR.3.49]